MHLAPFRHCTLVVITQDSHVLKGKPWLLHILWNGMELPPNSSLHSARTLPPVRIRFRLTDVKLTSRRRLSARHLPRPSKRASFMVATSSKLRIMAHCGRPQARPTTLPMEYTRLHRSVVQNRPSLPVLKLLNCPVRKPILLKLRTPLLK